MTDPAQTNTDDASVAKSWWKNLSEEKLLGLLLLALAGLLLMLLTVWKLLDRDIDKPVLPADESKYSVWFDENGPRLSAESEARLKTGRADQNVSEGVNLAGGQPEVLPKDSVAAGGAAGLSIKTVELGASPTAARDPQPRKAQANSAINYWVLLGTFSQIENADSLAKKVSAKASQVEVAPMQRASGTLYAVRVPVVGDRPTAQKLADRLAKAYSVKPLLLKAAN